MPPFTCCRFHCPAKKGPLVHQQQPHFPKEIFDQKNFPKFTSFLKRAHQAHHSHMQPALERLPALPVRIAEPSMSGLDSRN